MNHNHQLYRDRRARGAAADARADRRRPRARADGARSRAQPRLALPVPARQLFLLPVRLSRARGGRRAGRRRRTATGTCCSAARRTRSARSGTASATAPTRRARSSASTRRTRSRSSTAMLPDLASDRPALYTPLGLFDGMGPQGHRPAERSAQPRAHRRRARRRRSSTCAQALDALRLVKDEHEIALMRRAAAISARRAPARDGAHARRAGTSTRSRPSSRTSSCATARRRSPTRRSSPAAPTPACCTTATTTAQLQDGELLLIDAGCEYQGYASDITRTFPVNGRFTGPQKAVYELVLAAQHACLDAVQPGRRLPRLPQGRRARARAGLHRPRPVPGHARRGAGERQLQAVLHAPRRPLARAWTCTTPASTRSRARRRSSCRAWCSPSSRARTSGPPTTCRRHSGTSACASRTTCWSRRPASRT